MKTRNITSAIFNGAEWLKGKEALLEAKKITKDFTLDKATCYGVTSYTFLYSGNSVHIFYNPS